MAPPTSDSIAECVLQTFEALPAKCKPRKLADGRREWVPLAGIVLSRDHDSAPSLTCAALATGMKCLPQSKIAEVKGNVLHDWHAEVLAIRSFNRFLVDECADLARKGFGKETDGEREGERWVRWTEEGRRAAELKEQGNDDGCKHNALEDLENGHNASGPYKQPFALHPDVGIHMFCSEAPCGDASMELTMASQPDATPWAEAQVVGEDGLLGRGNFDQLGIVRRKPSRPDAPASLSKSCSDKLAMKQCTGLLSGLASLLIHPEHTYLDTLVMPESQSVRSAGERAFGAEGRMKGLMGEAVLGRWNRSGHVFKPFEVRTTSREFSFSKRTAKGTVAVPSNLSTMWTPKRQEILINGVLQGRKQLDPKGASCVSRRVMWRSILDVALLAGVPALTALRKRKYAEVKDAPELWARESVKKDTREMALTGWKRNVGDENWSLDHIY